MAVPSPSPSLKSALRARALSARRAFAATLDGEHRSALEADLAAIVKPHLRDARIVALYHAVRDEISPQLIADHLSPEQRSVLPWFADRESLMLFREGPAVEDGPWRIPQPPSGAQLLVPDLLLVPLVQVDRHGTRIGQGKGHYDRVLADLRASGPVRTIGIAWDVQISDGTIPADPWDVPLDAIATPTRWIDCR